MNKEKKLREELLTSVTGGVNGAHDDQQIIINQELQKKLDGKTVQVKTTDPLRIAVAEKEIAAAIEKQLGITIDKRKIAAPEIKRLGTYDFKVNIATGIVAKMTVEVV